MPSDSALFESALGRFPDSIRTDLEDIHRRGGVVPAERVVTWTKELKLNVEQLMMRLLPVAAAFGRPPLSGFHVGAVVQGAGAAWKHQGVGNLYLGANLEFADLMPDAGVHAEQAAFNNACLHDERAVQALAVSAFPCGACRQFLGELNQASQDLAILVPVAGGRDEGRFQSHSPASLLPQPFTPQELGVSGNFLSQMSHGLLVATGDAEVRQALAAANASYAPYTKSYAGVALATAEGASILGRYVECVAFTPSLSPLASALAQLNLQQPCGTAWAIARATLVEVGGQSRQQALVQAMLASVAPEVELRHVHCEGS